MSELALHQAVAHYLAVTLLPPATWCTIGHGGGGRARGRKLKTMGVKPGWPDLLILAFQRTFWIELKTAKGRLSPEQRAVHEDLIAAGACVAVCRSIEEVQQALEAWELPIRGRIAA